MNKVNKKFDSGPNHMWVINTLNLKLFSENFRNGLCWKRYKYKEWVSVFLGSYRSKEQTTRPSEAVHTILFVPRYNSFPMNSEKKDTYSLSKHITSMFIHIFHVLDSLVGGEWQNRAPAWSVHVCQRCRHWSKHMNHGSYRYTVHSFFGTVASSAQLKSCIVLKEL